MLRRTVQCVFYASAALLLLSLIAVAGAAVKAVWPALILSLALSLIYAATVRHERNTNA